jgi:hypothetical protein
VSTVARLSRSSSHVSTTCASLTNLGHRHSRFGGLSTPHPPKTPLTSNLVRRRSTGTTTAVTAASTTTSTVALRPTSCTSSAGAFLRVRSRAAVTAAVKWCRRVMVPWRQWQRDGGDGASRRRPPSPLRRRRPRWWSARDARRKRSRARSRRARAPPAHSVSRRNTTGGARHVCAAATPPPPLRVRDACDANVRVIARRLRRLSRALRAPRVTRVYAYVITAHRARHHRFPSPPRTTGTRALLRRRRSLARSRARRRRRWGWGWRSVTPRVTRVTRVMRARARHHRASRASLPPPFPDVTHAHARQRRRRSLAR